VLSDTELEQIDTMPLGKLDVSDPELYRSDSWRPYFARLRREAPVHYCSDGIYGPYWSVSTYDLMQEVELNHQVYSNRADLGGIQLLDIAPNLHRPSFVSMDPPEHTGRRRAVAPMTNRSGMKDMSGLIRERTAAVLDGLPRGKVFNWVEAVSMDLTSRMLATMFDYPQDRRHELMFWSDVATTNINAPDALVKTEDERYAELQRMAEAFVPLWQERQQGGEGFDLITMLANHEATMHMDREEFIGTLFLLIVGGNDTTRNSMTGGLLALDENPEALELVNQDRSLLPNMVQEMIRYQTPVIHMRRTALEDAELNGQTIAKGDKVVLWYVSANRDENVFPEPELFKVDRENSRRHLSFGAGIHRCVGDQLAALQLAILWEEILDRGIEIDVVGPPERVYSNFIRGFTSLPVKIVAG
jgi:cytochrome P450